jgi:hypothetical protein
MKAYSTDLREKVLRAVDQGYARGESIKLLGVSRATIKRYLRAATRDRRGGSQSHCGTACAGYLWYPSARIGLQDPLVMSLAPCRFPIVRVQS